MSHRIQIVFTVTPTPEKETPKKNPRKPAQRSYLGGVKCPNQGCAQPALMVDGEPHTCLMCCYS